MEIFRANASELDVSVKEAMRYMGVLNAEAAGDETESLTRKAVGEAAKSSVLQAVWDVFPLAVQGKTVSFEGVQLVSRDLTRFLTCHGDMKRIALLAATLGPKVDFLIRRAGATSASFSCALQGAAAAIVESFVDKCCFHIHESLNSLPSARRYSPGYGDVPLEVQKVFFNLLDCGKIGLALMDTLVMSPEKSVTAFIGVQGGAGDSADW